MGDDDQCRRIGLTGRRRRQSERRGPQWPQGGSDAEGKAKCGASSAASWRLREVTGVHSEGLARADRTEATSCSAFIGLTHQRGFRNVVLEMMLRDSECERNRVPGRSTPGFLEALQVRAVLTKDALAQRSDMSAGWGKAFGLHPPSQDVAMSSVQIPVLGHHGYDLPRWLVGIWLMCNSPKRVSAKQLDRDLGVHYETAWYVA